MSWHKRYSAELSTVHDGDTLTLHENGRLHKCRLAWLDAPELAQPHGIEARSALFAVLQTHSISVTVLRYDKYHREIVALRTDLGRDVNAWLILNGHAWYCATFGRGPIALPMFQLTAQEHRRGLWEKPNPTPPWIYRGALKTTHRPPRPRRIPERARIRNPE